MRVLQVTNGLRFGGAERIVEALALDLAAGGDRVEVVATTRDGPVGDELRRAGIPVTVLGIRSSLDARAPLHLAALIHRFRPDVVHSHLAVADITVAASSLAAPGPRRVSSVHNPGVELGPIKGRLGRLALRRFDRVLPVSRSVAEALPASLPLTIVRPSLVTGDPPRLSRAEARARLGVPDEVPLVLAVGRRVRVKGFDVLAAAAARLRTPGVRVLVIGEGPEVLDPPLEALGALPDAADLLAAADVVACASRSEGFPQVPLEAMAAARAVVATRVGGTPEIVEDGRTGRLVPPEEPAALATALDALLSDRLAADAMGRAGRDRLSSEGLTRGQFVARTRALYGEALRSR